MNVSPKLEFCFPREVLRQTVGLGTGTLNSQAGFEFSWCPPAHLFSQRLFSVAGDVMIPLRVRLLPGTAECLHYFLNHFSLHMAERLLCVKNL